MGDKIPKSKLQGTTLVVETTEGTETYDAQSLVAALLVFIARGSGRIEPEEAAKIIELIRNHFGLHGPESLELIRTAMSEMMHGQELPVMLAELGATLTDGDKEEIALMGLKVVAADGRRHAAEMEQFNKAMAAIGIPPEVMHRAFDRYFAETMPGI